MHATGIPSKRSVGIVISENGLKPTGTIKHEIALRVPECVNPTVEREVEDIGMCELPN